AAPCRLLRCRDRHCLRCPPATPYFSLLLGANPLAIFTLTTGADVFVGGPAQRAKSWELETTNFHEFSTCSDAEAVLGGIVRISIIVAPRGILLVVHMASDRPGNQNNGCAGD